MILPGTPSWLQAGRGGRLRSRSLSCRALTAALSVCGGWLTAMLTETAYDRYAGLIFDLDGTLIDSMPVHAAAWVQVCSEHGYELDPEFIFSHGGLASGEIARELQRRGCQTGEVQAFTRRKMELYRMHIDEVQPIAAVRDILLRGSARGQRIAVATGTQRINAMHVLTRLQLMSHIQVLVTAEDVVRHKPHPETFLTAAAQLQLPPEACLVFEDAPPGLQAAAAGGFDCVAVSRSGQVAERILTPAAVQGRSQPG